MIPEIVFQFLYSILVFFNLVMVIFYDFGKFLLEVEYSGCRIVSRFIQHDITNASVVYQFLEFGKLV